SRHDVADVGKEDGNREGQHGRAVHTAMCAPRRGAGTAFFDAGLSRVPHSGLCFGALSPKPPAPANPMAEGKNLVGVDIGASSIKVVQLKEARKKLQIVRWGYAPLPPQTIIDGHVMNAGAVTESLARIFQDNKIQQRDVAIGVYGQSVI